MRMKDVAVIMNTNGINFRSFISDNIENRRKYLIDIYNRSIGLGFEYATVGNIDYIYENNLLKIINYQERLGKNGVFKIPNGFDSFYPDKESWAKYLETRRYKINKIDLGTIRDIDYGLFENLYVENFIANSLVYAPSGMLNYCVELKNLEIKNILFIDYDSFRLVQLTSLKVNNKIYYGDECEKKIKDIKKDTLSFSAV